MKMNYVVKYSILLLLANSFSYSTNSFAANAMLTWISGLESGMTQVNVQRMYDDVWQPVEVVYQSRERNYSPSIGSNSIGEAMVVWTATSTVRSVTRALLFQNDNWQSVQVISNQGGQTTMPAVIFDQNNDAFVAWVSDHNGLDDVYLRRWFSDSNQWSEAEKVNRDNNTPDVFPNFEVEQNGDVSLLWQGIDLESGNYISMSRVYQVLGVESPLTLSSEKEHKELNYTDISMPESWTGSVGAAVIHFPDNKSILYEKLPRHLSQ